MSPDDELPSTGKREQTARHRSSSARGEDRYDAGKRKSIPAGLLDDMDLPSAPAGQHASRAAIGTARKADPEQDPKAAALEPANAPRRPGQIMKESRPEPSAGTGTPVGPLLEGADLFRAGAELPQIGMYGKYEILGRLAMGGMAEILLARAPDEARPIVLKKILATFDSDSEFVEMFLDEAHIGMQLDHPNIARFLDAGEVHDRYYIAMEWVNGVTFGRMIRRGRSFGGLPIPFVCKVVSQVADALHYAHTSRDADGTIMGLIHRDVSPHNIMVAYDGTVKLLDFGIAKAMVSAHTTGAGVVKGKFAYMAPEQCRGEELDFRIDIFALGVVLFEGLTGKSLYRRDSDVATMQAIVNGPVPSLSDVLVGVPRELDAICRTALSKDPGQRFPTAAAMRDVLRMFVDRSPDPVETSDRSALVQMLFAKELTRGPSVDSTPFGSSYKFDLSSEGGAGPTLAPPRAPVALTVAPPARVESSEAGGASLSEPSSDRLSSEELFGDEFSEALSSEALSSDALSLSEPSSDGLSSDASSALSAGALFPGASSSEAAGDQQDTRALPAVRPLGERPGSDAAESKSGSHQVEPTRPSFSAVAESVQVPAPKSSRRWLVAAFAFLLVVLAAAFLWVRFTVPERGSVLVSSEPSGVQVLVDGEPAGSTPAAVNDLPAGAHVLTLERDGVEVYRQELQVRAGRISEVDIEFE